jgi:hypothetical protein
VDDWSVRLALGLTNRTGLEHCRLRLVLTLIGLSVPWAEKCAREGVGLGRVVQEQLALQEVEPAGIDWDRSRGRYTAHAKETLRESAGLERAAGISTKSEECMANVLHVAVPFGHRVLGHVQMISRPHNIRHRLSALSAPKHAQSHVI